MSNLTRPTVDLLINSISVNDIGNYVVGTEKHVILKKAGFDFIGANSTAIIKRAKQGNKMKRIITPIWTWSGESSEEFAVEIIRQPIFNTEPEGQFQRAVLYNFVMKSFVTDTPGTLDAADAKAIIDGLVLAINANVQLNSNAVMTGAVVVASNSGNTLVLEAKENGTIFTCHTYDDQFTQPLNPTVPYKKDKLTEAELWRTFSIKEENIGSYVDLPIRGVPYACITISTETPFVGLDLLGGKGQTVRQDLNIYMPVSQLTVDVAKLAVFTDGNASATAASNVIGMAGTGADKDIIELLTAHFAQVTDLDT